MQTNQRTNVALLISLLVLMVLTMGALLTFVDDFGHRIPSHDLASDYLVAWTLAFGFGFLLIALPIKSELKGTMLLFWAARCFVTLGVMLFYESFYALDTVAWYQQSRHLILEPNLIWGSGTENITVMYAIVNALLPIDSTFHCLKVIWSFVGLFGVYFFYRGIVRATGYKSNRLFYVLGLFPSILFWSSHAHKDPIVFFGIGLYFYGAFSVLNQFSPKSFFCVVAGLLIAGSMRFWTAPIFLFPLIIVLILRARSNIFWRTGILASLFYLQMLFVQFVINSFSFTSRIDVLAIVETFSRGWAVGGSAQEVPEFSSTADVVRFMPWAMFSSLFRPFPGEIMNAFGLMAGVENSILLVVVAYGLFKAAPYIYRSSTILLTLLSITFWSAIYCFVSYQNLGTAVRFKLQVLPLLLAIPFIAFIESQPAEAIVPVGREEPPKQ
jgi:hypothetical protein